MVCFPGFITVGRKRSQFLSFHRVPSWCRIPASRAVQGIITDPFVPWGEPDTHLRFRLMDPAIHFTVAGTKEERAMMDRVAVRVHPVVNPPDAGQVEQGDVISCAPPPA